MKRLFLLMVFMAVSIQADAAKMSSYTENTTPNDDVYFIGVDPNDTTQTVNGSNYRYPLSSILGSGLLDFNVNSLTVSGSGDSWLELNNNASFSGSLVGKYGYSFLTANPTAIINGTTSRLALYSELGTTSITEGTATADPSTMSTGEIYIETDTGTTTIKTALGSVAISGTYTADLGIAPTLTSLTIPTSGATATAVFSEAMTVGAGGNGGWTLNTPTNAMTYASGSGTDTIVFNLAATITDADTPTVSYTQPGDGWESDDDNVDLATISGDSVTNNSTEVAASGLEDTFTDTDSTALASHTADSSHTWTQNGGGGLQVYSNRVESTQSTSAGLYYSSFEPADADYAVSLDMMTVGSGISPFVAGRCATGAVTMYAVRWNGTDTWELTKWVSGSRTVIDTYVGDSPVGVSRTVALVMVGTSITATIGGTERLTATDSDISAAGRPGIGTWYCGVSESHIIYADNMVVTE